MRKRISSNDVAKLAGVSRATVSYVLNGSSTQTIPETTKKKVLDAAEKLGYFPNRQARTLKTKKTDCICVMICQNIEMPGPAATLQGIRKVLNEHGYTILLSSNARREDKPYPEYIHSYLESYCDGIILLGYDLGTGFEEYIDVIRKFQIPFLMINPERFYDEFYSVAGEKWTGQEEIIRICASEGYREFIYIFPDHLTDREKERMENYLSMCREKGYTCRTAEFPMKIDVRLSSIKKGSDDDYQKTVKYAEGIRQIDELVKGKEQEICFVVPWQQMAASLMTFFTGKENKPAIAVLSGASPDISLYAVYGGKILFSDMQFMKCGEAAAQKMIRILEGGAIEQHTVIPAAVLEFN